MKKAIPLWLPLGALLLANCSGNKILEPSSTDCAPGTLLLSIDCDGANPRGDVTIQVIRKRDSRTKKYNATLSCASPYRLELTVDQFAKGDSYEVTVFDSNGSMISSSSNSLPSSCIYWPIVLDGNSNAKGDAGPVGTGGTGPQTGGVAGSSGSAVDAGIALDVCDASNWKGRLPNLAGCNLANADLTDADLSNVDLTNANLSNSNLAGVVLEGAKLQGVSSGGITTRPKFLPAGWVFLKGYLVGPGANLMNAALSGVKLIDANLTDTLLAGADLSGVSSGGITGIPKSLPTGWKLVGGYLLGPSAVMFGAQLKGLDLSNVNLTNADVGNSDLSNSNLSGAILKGTNLANSSLSGTNLTGSTLSGATLVQVRSGGIVGKPLAIPERWSLISGYLVGPQATLTGSVWIDADLTGVVFFQTNLDYANFSGANLTRADFLDATMIGANLSRTILTNAYLGSTNLKDANFVNAKVSEADFNDLTICPDGKPNGTRIRCGL
jgi:uncharacterized protein YjbI with pentapeptide repeats